MRQFENPWSPEEIARAKALRNEGYPASYIGKELGRSRNAVTGKIWREENDYNRAPVKPVFAPFPSIEDITWDDDVMEADAARTMWLAVLNVTVDDALGKNKEKGTRKIVTRDKARAWLRSQDFVDVCALAGVDPDSIYSRVQELIAMAEFEESGLQS